MLFKRATPMPPFAYYVGKLAMCLLFGSLMVAWLFILGATAGGVRLSAATWLSLAGRAGGRGRALRRLRARRSATGRGPNSAPAIINLISLPAAFGSGHVDPHPDDARRAAEDRPLAAPPITSPSSR